jgi:hypothetical protein
VAGGHTTDTPAQTYSTVVSRDSVRLAFLIAALNGIDIAACDVGNAYRIKIPVFEGIFALEKISIEHPVVNTIFENKTNQQSTNNHA